MTAFEPQIDIEGLTPYSKPNSDNYLSAADYQDQQKNGKTWKLLKSTHHEYDQRTLNVRKENLLYVGGFQMNEPEIAKLFCPQMKSEEDQVTYKERVGSAAYVPVFSKLTTGLISNLFSQDLAVMEAADHDDPTTLGDAFEGKERDYYKEFSNDCDAYGTTLHNFIKDRTTKALVHTYCFFGVDYPKGEATNRLEQEQLGLDKPRLYKIPVDSVFDWQIKEDNCHEFQWLKLVSCLPHQPTPFDPPMHQYLVKCWTINEEGYACYECYQSEPLPANKEPKDKDVLQKIDEGATGFKRIPVFYYYFDEGTAVGAKLAPMAAEHFNRTTIENHSTNKACLTIPVIYRGDMLPGGDSLPDPAGMNMQRGQHPRGKVNSKGVVELGSYTQDRLEIVEAEGKALTFIHKQNEDLEEKMHSVIHQMGQSLKQANSQSGKTATSKQEDRHAMEMLLTAIADEVYAITEEVFKTISESRGEDIVWEVKGLSAISQEDRDELAKEAGLLPTLQIHSMTFKKEYEYRIASRLVDGTDQRTLQTIRAEIEQGLEDVGDPLPVPTPAEQQQLDQQNQQTKAAPITKSANPKVNSPGGSDAKQIGEQGQALLPEGGHLQTGEHIDAQVVYDQLVEDYNDKDIQWVLHIPWRGPVEVPLSSIDFSNKDNWAASDDQEAVAKFADKMANDQFNKPIILVNNPSNDNKMMVVDGHHRSLGALQNGQPVVAYVGDVGSTNGPWDKLHAKQVGSKQGSGQKEASVQKAAVAEVKKSEKAPGGKTK